MTAKRLESITPFHVMALLARARQLEAEGRSIVHMEIGEPDFVTPEPIVAAGIGALEAGHTHYTPAVGLPALRQAIAQFYADEFDVTVDPARILVTPGASGALQLIIGHGMRPGGEHIYPNFYQAATLQTAKHQAAVLIFIVITSGIKVMMP